MEVTERRVGRTWWTDVTDRRDRQTWRTWRGREGMGRSEITAVGQATERLVRQWIWTVLTVKQPIMCDISRFLSEILPRDCVFNIPFSRVQTPWLRFVLTKEMRNIREYSSGNLRKKWSQGGCMYIVQTYLNTSFAFLSKLCICFDSTVSTRVSNG